MSIRDVALVQIAYWAVGAVWPLAHMRSFEAVTGDKRDEWLVRTVALLMLSVIATLDVLRRDDRDGADAMRVLGTTSSAALGGVALIGALVGRIRKVYLLDALIDLALAAGYVGARRERAGRRAV